MNFVEALKENLNSIYGEFFGEKTDHPFLGRLLAFAVDFALVLLLNAIQVLIWFLFEQSIDAFLHPIIVTAIIALYFTLGNSRISKGQTLGKKLLRIRVTDLTGNTISPFRSFVRSVFPSLLVNSISTLDHLIINDYRVIAFWLYITCAIIFLASIYFLIVNQNRRVPHDLIVYSQVIPSKRVVQTTGHVSLGAVIGCVVLVTAYLCFVLR